MPDPIRKMDINPVYSKNYILLTDLKVNCSISGAQNRYSDFYRIVQRKIANYKLPQTYRRKKTAFYTETNLQNRRKRSSYFLWYFYLTL